MDKNTVIGLLLIFALFLGFSFYQTSQMKKQKAAQEAQMLEEIEKETEETAHALSLDNQPDTTGTTVEKSAVATLTPAQRFSNAQVSEDGDYMVETAKAYYFFSKKGGYLKQIELKDVYRYTPKDSAKQPLVIYDGGSNSMSIKLMLRDQTEVSTGDCYFVANTEELVVDGKHNKLSLRLYPNAGADSTQCQVLDQNSYIEYLYTFSNDDYKFDYEINVVNMEPYLYPSRHAFTMQWEAQPKCVEKNFDYEKNITSIYYMDNSDDVGNLDERKPDKKDFTAPLKWVSFKQQFFTTCLVTKEVPFTSGSLSVQLPEDKRGNILKDCTADRCEQGMFFSSVTDSVMTGCTATGTRQGFFMAAGGGNMLADCTANGCENGYHLEAEGHVLMTSCTAEGCTVCGIQLDRSPAVLAHNILRNNWVDVKAYGGASMDIADNLFTGSGICGLYLRDIGYSRLSGNRFENSGRYSVLACGSMGGSVWTGNETDVPADFSDVSDGFALID